MRTLDKNEKIKLKQNFLFNLGNYIRLKREKRGASVQDVAQFLGSDKAMISRYENGTTEMGISTIQLLSMCCEFSMKDCFSSMEKQDLVNQFHDIIKIERKRYQRKYKPDKQFQPFKQLKAYIYEVDGELVEEPARGRAIPVHTLRTQLLNGEKVFPERIVPFTKEEVLIYLSREENRSIAELLEGTTKIFECIDTMSGKERFKEALADMIVESTIVEKIIKDDDYDAKRMYLYYKRFMEKYMESDIFP